MQKNQTIFFKSPISLKARRNIYLGLGIGFFLLDLVQTIIVLIKLKGATDNFYISVYYNSLWDLQTLLIHTSIFLFLAYRVQIKIKRKEKRDALERAFAD